MDPVTGEEIYWVEFERRFVRDPKLHSRVESAMWHAEQICQYFALYVIYSYYMICDTIRLYSCYMWYYMCMYMCVCVWGLGGGLLIRCCGLWGNDSPQWSWPYWRRILFCNLSCLFPQRSFEADVASSWNCSIISFWGDDDPDALNAAETFTAPRWRTTSEARARARHDVHNDAGAANDVSPRRPLWWHLAWRFLTFDESAAVESPTIQSEGGDTWTVGE